MAQTLDRGETNTWHQGGQPRVGENPAGAKCARGGQREAKTQGNEKKRRRMVNSNTTLVLTEKSTSKVITQEQGGNPCKKHGIQMLLTLIRLWWDLLNRKTIVVKVAGFVVGPIFE